MPIFEYECNGCGHQFEFLQLNKNELVNCPECNSEKVTRLFSVFGFLSGARETPDNHAGSKCSSCSRHSCSTCNGVRS